MGIWELLIIVLHLLSIVIVMYDIIKRGLIWFNIFLPILLGPLGLICYYIFNKDK